MKLTTQYLINRIVNKVLVVIGFTVALGLAGCQPDNPTEKAEKKMDKVTETAKDTIENSNNAANRELGALKESVEQNAERAKAKIDENIESTKKVLEKSEQEIDTNAQLAKEKVERIDDNVEKKLDDLKDIASDKANMTGDPIDDAMITSKVKAAIMGSTWLNASHIEVRTNSGVVTLSGTVDSEQNIARAIEVASSQEHVKKVQSDLIVAVTESSKKR